MSLVIRRIEHTRQSLAKPGMGIERAISRVLCIVGPTSSGKTSLAIALAKRFHGEVINADARQVYQEFDIGTGKPAEGKHGVFEGHRAFLVAGVPHFLMDFLPPDQVFTVAEWRKKALTAIRGISSRGHLPMVVGGTGLYVQALVDNYLIPHVPPQPAYRAAMESKSLSELCDMLRKVDPGAADVVDLKNRRRVLRALEVVTFTGKPFNQQRRKSKPVVDPLFLAIEWPREVLYKRIDDAVENMIERGWIDEIRRLHEAGTPWNAPAMTSIGYRELSAYVRGECGLEEAIAKVKLATHHYAKRQLTWFNRDKRIHWVKDEEEARRIVEAWIG